MAQLNKNKRFEMQSLQLAGAKPQHSTQLFLDLAEIKNDTVIMRDGTLRGVMMVSSLNFALKSEEEQAAVVSAYVGFLNFLDFPIQIVIQSRKLDISNYLQRLKDREKQLTNELLRRQMVDYQEYIRELVDLGDIMSKRFYLVVPYSPIEDKDRGFWSRFTALFSPGQVIKLKQQKFDEYSHVLNQRITHIQSTIAGIGLDVVRLDTEGLIELYYNCYNPHMAGSQKLVETEMLRVEE